MILVLTCINTCQILIINQHFKSIKLFCLTKLCCGHLNFCVQTYRQTHRRHNKSSPLSHSLPPKGLKPRRASLALVKIMKYLYIPDLQIVHVRIDLNYN